VTISAPLSFTPGGSKQCNNFAFLKLIGQRRDATPCVLKTSRLNLMNTEQATVAHSHLLKAKQQKK
jgi:hypothetical protein